MVFVLLAPHALAGVEVDTPPDGFELIKGIQKSASCSSVQFSSDDANYCRIEAVGRKHKFAFTVTWSVVPDGGGVGYRSINGSPGSNGTLNAFFYNWPKKRFDQIRSDQIENSGEDEQSALGLSRDKYVKNGQAKMKFTGHLIVKDHEIEFDTLLLTNY